MDVLQMNNVSLSTAPITCVLEYPLVVLAKALYVILELFAQVVSVLLLLLLVELASLLMLVEILAPVEMEFVLHTILFPQVQIAQNLMTVLLDMSVDLQEHVSHMRDSNQKDLAPALMNAQLIMEQVQSVLAILRLVTIFVPTTTTFSPNVLWHMALW